MLCCRFRMVGQAAVRFAVALSVLALLRAYRVLPALETQQVQEAVEPLADPVGRCSEASVGHTLAAALDPAGSRSRVTAAGSRAVGPGMWCCATHCRRAAAALAVVPGTVGARP